MSDESPRARRLADRIKVIVAEMIEMKIKDPRLGFVTVTDAYVTNDLREATVFYTVLGDAEEQEATAAALSSATGLLRSVAHDSTGERAGWVQKFSNKGWICKTWEGELAMVSMPGVAPEKFLFTIRDNGGEMPYFLHNTESMAQGFELPICWARFTPLEKTPVVQTYSMQPGATVVRGQADGDL